MTSSSLYYLQSTNSSAGLPTQMQLGLLSPQYLRRLFERMGATYIKLGQVSHSIFQKVYSFWLFNAAWVCQQFYSSYSIKIKSSILVSITLLFNLPGRCYFSTNAFLSCVLLVHSICTYIVPSRICTRISELFRQSSISSFSRNSSNLAWGIRKTNRQCVRICWPNTSCLGLNCTGKYSSSLSCFTSIFCISLECTIPLSYFHFLLVFLTCSKFEYNAQVHAARLKGSQDDVVIKVLKPGIKDILVADLNFVYIVARILEFLNPELSRASLVWCLFISFCKWWN